MVAIVAVTLARPTMRSRFLSRICSHAVAEGALSLNPYPGIPNLYHANRAIIVWSADQLAALTGLRQDDLMKLAWSHVGAHAIEMPQARAAARGSRSCRSHRPCARFSLRSPGGRRSS